MSEHVAEVKEESGAVESWENEGGQSEGVIETSEASFAQDVLRAERPVLVDFWAEWCPACHQIAPVVDEIAAHYGASLRVAKMNVDDNFATAQRYGVKGIPTLILFKNGKEEGRIVGTASREAIATLLANHASADVSA